MTSRLLVVVVMACGASAAPPEPPTTLAPVAASRAAPAPAAAPITPTPDAGVAAVTLPTGEPLPAELVTPATRDLKFTIDRGTGTRIWPSEPVLEQRAEIAWRELLSKPHIVPVIVRRDHELHMNPHGSKQLAARVALARLRASRATTDAWKAWDKLRASAAITADDDAEARELLAHAAAEQPMVMLQIVEGTPGDAVARSTAEATEVLAIFADWQRRYGARLFAWDGANWTFAVERPPSAPTELRTLAGELALACPAGRSGSAWIVDEDTPGFVMAKLRLDRWVCYWFLE